MNISSVRLIVTAVVTAAVVFGIIMGFSGESPVFAGENGGVQTITGYLEELLKG